jgi:hypothetical protein
MRFLLWSTGFVGLVFLLPALATVGWWALVDRPLSWRAADWSSAGILPEARAGDPAAIHVLAARTGGLKGALSVHSWIVLKKPGVAGYERWDKVGWGMPVRRNSRAADGRWYSNAPIVVKSLEGAEAEALLPKFERAIAEYPYAQAGGYRLWPGPNSNSFVAHVLRAVPEFDAVLPANAVGRDYRPGIVAFDIAPDWTDLHVTLGGVVGFAAGRLSGFELHFAGLVAGLDLARPALKVPGLGRVPLLPAAFAGTQR